MPLDTSKAPPKRNLHEAPSGVRMIVARSGYPP
jgi:hypothetical protein